MNLPPFLSCYIYYLPFVRQTEVSLCFSVKTKWLGVGTEPSKCPPIHPQRHRQHDELHHKLRPDHAIKAKDHVHEDKQRDVQKPLAAKGEYRRLRAFAHGLQGVADEKIHRREWHRQASDTQKRCTKSGGFCFRNEKGQDLWCKNHESTDEASGNANACFP